MKKSLFKTHVFTTTLLAVFAVVGFAQFTFANIWQAPTGPNVPAPINTSSTSQIKGGNATLDVNALAPDPTVSLSLIKSGPLSTGLFTEGFLSLGHVPTFGFISGSLAQIAGTFGGSRAPLQLLAGTNAPLANIVLSNLGGTNTTRLGVWSEKDNNWANTRIKNGYFNNLLIKGGDDSHKMVYQQGGIWYTKPASYTRRFMGFIFNNNVSNHSKPSSADADFYLAAADTPDTIDHCNGSTLLGPNGINGRYAGDHRYCIFDNGFMYEMVPPTNLDVAGETDIGNGGTCVIRSSDECPLGSYLQKIGSFGNNVCKAFSGTCTAPNTPNATLNEAHGAAYGSPGVAWIKAQKVPGAQNLAGLTCTAGEMNAVAASGTQYFFPNPLQYAVIDLDGPSGEAQAGTVIYTPGTYMTGSPGPGVYRLLFDDANSTHYGLTVNNANDYLMLLGESSEIIEVNDCA